VIHHYHLIIINSHKQKKQKIDNIHSIHPHSLQPTPGGTGTGTGGTTTSTPGGTTTTITPNYNQFGQLQPTQTAQSTHHQQQQQQQQQQQLQKLNQDKFNLKHLHIKRMQDQLVQPLHINIHHVLIMVNLMQN